MDAVTRSIPVIVWSAATNQLRDKESWLAEHGIPTLPKPFDIDALYESIEVALAGTVQHLQAHSEWDGRTWHGNRWRAAGHCVVLGRGMGYADLCGGHR